MLFRSHVCAVVRSIDDVQRAFDHLGIETREIRNYAKPVNLENLDVRYTNEYDE